MMGKLAKCLIIQGNDVMALPLLIDTDCLIAG